MLDGRVTVNGATIRELGTKADPSRDDIRVDGRRIKIAGAPSLPAAEQAARLRDDAIGSAETADGDRSADGRARVRLPGRPARLRLRRPAAAHQRRRPGGEAHASAPRRARASTRRRCSACPTRTISSGSRKGVDDRRPAHRPADVVRVACAAATRDAADHRSRRTQPPGAEDVRRDRPPGRRSCGASRSDRFATRRLQARALARR